MLNLVYPLFFRPIKILKMSFLFDLKRTSNSLFLTFVALFLSVKILQGQNIMPDNAMSIVIKSAEFLVNEPRKALEMLKPLKQKFLREGSYENLEDVAVFSAIIHAESLTLSLNKRYPQIFRSLNEFQTNIKPLCSNHDDYAIMYFTNKIEILAYKAQEKGMSVRGNTRYRGDLKKIMAEVKAFPFKSKLNQNTIIAVIESYL